MMIEETSNQNANAPNRSSMENVAVEEITHDEEELDVGKAETKAVSTLRLVLMTLLTVVTIVISYLTGNLSRWGASEWKLKSVI